MCMGTASKCSRVFPARKILAENALYFSHRESVEVVSGGRVFLKLHGSFPRGGRIAVHLRMRVWDVVKFVNLGSSRLCTAEMMSAHILFFTRLCHLDKIDTR